VLIDVAMLFASICLRISWRLLGVVIGGARVLRRLLDVTREQVDEEEGREGG
jgi:hypothetical protein